MNGWAVFFLGVIAVATLATAILQIGLIVYAGRLMQRLTTVLDDVERELKPLLANANAAGRDAARAASLAASLMERADQGFATVAARVEEVTAAILGIILRPARGGRALWAILRAVIAGLRRSRRREQERRPDDDPSLFI